MKLEAWKQTLAEWKAEAAETEARLNAFAAAGRKPTYRSVVLFENGGSLATGAGETNVAQARATAAQEAYKWDRSPSYNGSHVVWFGEELEKP